MTKKRKVKTDVVLKDFWRQNDRFADLFNAVMFGGEQVLKPEELHEMDTDMSGIIQFRDHEESLVRESDQYVFHNEDVRTVFEISREIFKGNVDKITALYKDRDIKSELIRVIGKITDSEKLISQGNSGEVANMCTAMKKWEEECRLAGLNAGLSAGRDQGYQERDRELVLQWTGEGYSVEMIAKLLKKPEEFVRKVLAESEVSV